ncbi:sugar phosphate isomerase/epimerase family protein [Thalassotalea agarivorans]|uniref:Sugar phosphate isomerase/epimerase n=1 Tax=Thalassotalea agarivorans TaxID=349064 RepID=A0A1H9Y8Q5_THASX|nr:sugar phosphate isomerase/epimerase [Thalassotalea agarivorans]SES64817.1 Sugar phosphate isomerase/epimerase [Thalassotalea agarivorans]
MKKIINMSIVVALISLVSACMSSSKTTIPPLSVQLWSVKDSLKQDFKGTLSQLADMGFDGVEFAGEFGEFKEDPKGLKTYLSSLGLVASGAHVGVDQLNSENIDATLTFYKNLGVSLLIVPWDERAWHPEGVKALVAELNSAAKYAKSSGVAIGFHNHDKEFNEYENETYWDYIAQNTAPDVFLQLDVGWVNYAGKDAIAYVKRYPNRTLTTHYKIVTKEGLNQSPILGQDDYDWAALINTMVKFGNTKWIVVEQEEYPNGLSELQSVAASKAGLDAIIADMK